MRPSICPHCGKTTEGETRDKGVYIFVVCTNCDTILATLPKFYQKVTWKSPRDHGMPEKEDEDEDEEEDRRGHHGKGRTGTRGGAGGGKR